MCGIAGLVRHGGANAEDTYSAKSGSNLSALSNAGNLVLSGVTIGTEQNSAGTLILKFNANATEARVNEAMQDVPADGTTSGELVVRAPWLTPGYTGDTDASDTLWRGGWLHTQDIATIDADGYLIIRDRMKDVIKSGGEWVSSLALEEFIEHVEGVAKIAVIGVPDPCWGERPIGVVVPKEGALPGLDLLNAAINAAIGRGELSQFARLNRVEIVDSLPVTSVGKVDKKQLRLQFPA